MLKFTPATASQIRFLLQSLNDANSDSILRELSQFIEYGIEGSILLLQTCLDHLTNYRTELKNAALERVFASIFKSLLDRPNFSTVFCQSLRNTEISEGILENVSNALHLSVSEKTGIALALSDSENLDTRICGKNFCMAQIQKLCENANVMNSSEQIHNIVMFLHRSEGLSKHVDSFMQMLSLLQLKDDSFSVLTPLLSDELRDANFLSNVDLLHENGENNFDAILSEMEKEISMGDIMKELGYGCTVDSSQCSEILSLFLPLTEITISKILGMIASTHVGLEDNQNTFSTFWLALGNSTLSDLPMLNTWNIDVLVDTIMQLAPGTNWIQVIENLDHEGFYIPNQEAFSFFMSVYQHVCQDPFPLHVICRSVWKNTEGQLSFLKHAISAPPEVFTFAHSVRQLAYIDAVHGHKLQLGHANHAWLSLDLLDVLCLLAERGHALPVRSMLEHPLKHCPEVLLLGMAHTNTLYNLLQYEVSYTVFPMMVKNATGSGIINHLWHINTSLVLRGFMDSHNCDPDSIARILDICQELKILSSVLEMIPSSFSIRLAALASRKELVDLEKWLSNNLNAHKDIFFEECIKFLKEIQFSGSQDFSTRPFQHSGAVSNIFVDTATIFLKVLKAHVGLIASSQLTEELERLSVTIMDSNPRLQNCDPTESTDGYADDIEAEANSYFHQMFSGQLTIDSMVQMLARFKESSIKRYVC
ncbi:hypothetical protein PS2_027535 [Malus domestica]